VLLAALASAATIVLPVPAAAAGAQNHACTLFLLGEGTPRHLDEHGGFAFGVEPSVAIADADLAKPATPTMAKDRIDAFVFRQQDAMPARGFQGNAITGNRKRACSTRRPASNPSTPPHFRLADRLAATANQRPPPHRYCQMTPTRS
jgi:hypothetical protein